MVSVMFCVAIFATLDLRVQAIVFIRFAVVSLVGLGVRISIILDSIGISSNL